MKKIVVILILTVIGYGITDSAASKYNSGVESKLESRQEKRLSSQVDDEIEFHPLIFVCITFK